MTTITQSQEFRYSSPSQINVKHEFRYGTNPIQVNHGFRYNAPLGFQVNSEFRYSSFPTATVIALTGTNGTVQTPTYSGGTANMSGNGVFQQVSFRVWVNNNGTIQYLLNETNSYVSKITINKPKNQPMTWEIELQDPNGTLSPRTSGVWSDMLATDVYDPSGSVLNINGYLSTSAGNIIQPTDSTANPFLNFEDSFGNVQFTGKIIKTVNVEVFITTNGNTVNYTFPNLVLLRRKYEASKDGYRLTISGTDVVGRQLIQKDITLPSAISTDLSPVFASQVVAATLQVAGITNYKILFDDFPIRQMHIQNEKPLDIINKILFVNNGIWYSQGDYIILQQPGIEQSSAWTYQDFVNIFRLGETEEVTDLVNIQTVANPAFSGLSSVTITGAMWNRYSASFNPPLTGTPSVRIIQERGGVIPEIDYFDINGNWVGHYNLQTDPTIPSQQESVEATGGGVNYNPGQSLDLISGIPGNILNTISPSGAQIASCEFNFVPNSPVTLTPTPVFGNVPPPGNSQASGTGQNGSGSQGQGFNALNPTSGQPSLYFEIVIQGQSRAIPRLTSYLPPPILGISVPASILTSMPSYDAMTLGGSTADISADQQFAVTVQDSDSISKFGLWPGRPIENLLIPNLAWAYRVAVQVLITTARLHDTVEWRAPFNPFMNNGDIATVIESVSQLNNAYTIESQKLECGTNIAPTTTFTGVAYQLT